MSKVYLCGPIAGCTDDQAMSWREKAKSVLGEENCLDPMRRDYRGREAESVVQIVELDKDDIYDTGFVIANCWQVSTGTDMEILFAWQIARPVVAVVPEGARVSPWLTYHAEVTTSFDYALSEAARALQHPDPWEFRALWRKQHMGALHG
jgi:hypothetical protein